LRQQKNEEVVERIKEIQQSNRRVYGSPRIHAELKTPGGACSRKRIARLMQTHGISAKIRRRRVQTTESRQTNPIAENRRDRDFLATEPHRKWLTDRTAMRTAEGWLSLAVVLDLYSRLVGGWSMSIHRDARLVENALHMALARRHPPGGWLHHSDRGSQYTRQQYQEQLAQAGIEVSMSRKGNCWDNAPMESFFGTLKTEWVDQQSYGRYEEARQSIFEYIETFYKRKRRHSTLGEMSPVVYEQQRNRKEEEETFFSLDVTCYACYHVKTLK